MPILSQRGFRNRLFLFEHALLRNPDGDAVLLNRTATVLVLKSDSNYWCNFIHRGFTQGFWLLRVCCENPAEQCH